MRDDALDQRTLALTGWIEETRALAMHWFRQPLSIDRKSDGSPVTNADLAIESLLRSNIQRSFPDDAILGEEHSEQPGSSGWRWIIDPIDGTASFMRGLPLWGTLVAIEHSGTDATRRVVAGVADFPALDERLEAPSTGTATWIHSGSRRACRVAPPRSLADATVCTTGTEYFRQRGLLAAWSRLGQTCGSLRGWSDCTGLLLLCTGRVDAVVEPVMNPWDIGPFGALLAAAGGAWTALDGTTSHLAGSLIGASNPLLLAQVTVSLGLAADSRLPDGPHSP